MELHHLRIFVIVAEEQNLTKGARRLYMTPPAVSAQIKALEDELGVSLFVRTPKGMVLTEKGKRLKLKAEQALQAAQEVVNHATSMQSQLMGRLRYGLNAAPAFLRVAPLVQQMQDVCPGIELELIASSTGSILDELDQETMDAGYIFGASPSQAIATYPLKRAEVVIAAPADWRDSVAIADWQDLADLPWVGTAGYCPFDTLTNELFRQRRLAINLGVRSHDEATKSELVAASIGLALLERSEAEQAQQTGRLVIWESSPMYCELNVACLAKRQAEPLIHALCQTIQDIWKVEDELAGPDAPVPTELRAPALKAT